VRVDFGSASDSTTVWISRVEFEIDYYPRLRVEVFNQFEATVEGIENAGLLVENPADIIEWLVTNEAGLDWAEETIDQTSFDQVRAHFETEGWRLSRRLGVPAPVALLLGQIAQESGCRLAWEAGRLRLLPAPLLLLASDAVAQIDATQILSAPLTKRSPAVGELANRLRVRYGIDGRRQSAKWVDVEAGGAGVAPWGWRESEIHAHWLASGRPAVASRLAHVWLAEKAALKPRVELDLPLSQCHLERGDVVVVHHPPSRLEGAIGEIVAIEFVDGRYCRATVALQTLAPYCWYGDAETFIAHLPGHTLKVFVVEGTRVATLDRAGRFCLRGEVVENGLGGHAQSAAIEHDPVMHRLYFGVGTDAMGYTAVSTLDADGRLLLRGAACEQADLSSISMEECHRAEPARFLFSVDLATAVFAYEAGANRLDLAGEFIENAPL
jgi:hypothetical protein